jgi:phytoene desaturase
MKSIIEKDKKVVVVGGGIAGLATAALLGKDGYKVTVLEKNPFWGGRASVYEEDGFIFDKGPSWYMMPEVFDHYFSLFGKKTQDFYQLKKLEVHYKVFLDDKKCYTIYDDFEKNIALFESIEKGGGEKLKKILNQAKFLYEKAMNDLVMLDYSSSSQILNLNILRFLFVSKLFKSLHKEIAKYFKNKDLQKILEFTTVFLGGSPYNTPAFYLLVFYADFKLGIYYPMGGMYKVVEALLKLCQENNVSLINNKPVISYRFEKNKIIAVKTPTIEYPADIVVFAGDYFFNETKLLPKKFQTYNQSFWKRKTLSPSAFIIYLGIEKKIKNAEHHNLYFSQSWEDGFQAIYQKRKWPENPSYYVHIPTKNDPGMAPEGCETLMFLVPVAPGLDDNDDLRERFSEKIIKHFENLIGEKLNETIKVKKIFAHRDFINQYNAYQGSAFGLAHTLLQTAVFRPKNKSKKVKNLYYAGQYTNPGIGVPPCLISAQITANLINKENG